MGFRTRLKPAKMLWRLRVLGAAQWCGSEVFVLLLDLADRASLVAVRQQVADIAAFCGARGIQMVTAGSTSSGGSSGGSTQNSTSGSGEGSTGAGSDKKPAAPPRCCVVIGALNFGSRRDWEKAQADGSGSTDASDGNFVTTAESDDLCRSLGAAAYMEIERVRCEEERWGFSDARGKMIEAADLIRYGVATKLQTGNTNAAITQDDYKQECADGAAAAAAALAAARAAGQPNVCGFGRALSKAGLGCSHGKLGAACIIC